MQSYKCQIAKYFTFLQEQTIKLMGNIRHFQSYICIFKIYKDTIEI